MDEEESENEQLKRIFQEVGLEVDIGGCGCCGSPWVRVKKDGKLIYHKDGNSVENSKIKMIPEGF